MEKLDISSLEDNKVELIEKQDGSPALEMKIAADALKYIDSVRFYLATLGSNNEVTVFGDDIDMDQDWDNGHALLLKQILNINSIPLRILS